MNFTTSTPESWLTDVGLTNQGKKVRHFYTQHNDYLQNSGLQSFQTARMKYFMQSLNYHTMQDGYALPPHTLNICVNNICDLKCKYCDFGQQQTDTFYYKFNVVDHKKRIELPFDLLKRIIDEVKWFRPIIRTSYREPMLYKNIFPFIEYVKKAGLPFWLLTNGMRLNKFAKELVRLKLDSVRLSLDGPEKIHDDMAGASGVYRKMMDGVKEMLEELERQGGNTQIGFYFTIHDHNYNHIIQCLEDLDKKGILKKVYINFQWLLYTSKNMAKRHNAEHAELCGARIEESTLQNVQFEKLDLGAMNRQAEEAKKRWPETEGYRIHFRPSFEIEDLERYQKSEDFPVSDPRCKVLWYNVTINPTGEVKSFHHCLLPTVGDLKENTFLDLWNGQAFREQRMKLQEYGAYIGCARCWGLYSLLEDKKRQGRL